MVRLAAVARAVVVVRFAGISGPVVTVRFAVVAGTMVAVRFVAIRFVAVGLIAVAGTRTMLLFGLMSFLIATVVVAVGLYVSDS